MKGFGQKFGDKKPAINIKEALALAPSEVCKRYSIKNCHYCEYVGCGDNHSPARKRIGELEAEVKKLRGGA